MTRKSFCETCDRDLVKEFEDLTAVEWINADGIHRAVLTASEFRGLKANAENVIGGERIYIEYFRLLDRSEIR